MRKNHKERIKRQITFILIVSCMISILCACGAKKTTKVTKDGVYDVEVTLSGGSGKAHVESPCKVTVQGGIITARIIWSSKNYDFMMVDGNRIEPVSMEENSVFDIPVSGEEMAVQADTIAMSQPHLIDYTLNFDLKELYETK